MSSRRAPAFQARSLDIKDFITNSYGTYVCRYLPLGLSKVVVVSNEEDEDHIHSILYRIMINMNNKSLYFLVAISAILLETTASAAASASPLTDKKLQQSSVLTDNLKFVAGDGHPSPSSSTFLTKTSSFLFKQFKNLLGGGGTHEPDYLRPSNFDLLEPFNAAYDVSITEKFLSESEIRHYRREWSRLAIGKPAVGFSGDRTWEEVFVPREILRRLINKGAEQCMSQEYEDTLPAGVHILTNHVKETTDPHVDYNPVTNKRIQNDVAVVFLNTNEDATFVVGKYSIPIEEGKLVIFPGGSVSHHIEMKNEKKGGGFVHMWGPLEIGGSHGTVGQVSRQLKWSWLANDLYQEGTAQYTDRRRQRQRMIEEGDDTANTSSTDAEITGFVTITGYKDGIDPSGEKNNTLEVKYKLKGCNGECTVLEVEDNPNFCDEVEIGELDNDNSEGDVDIIEDISITDDVVEYINVNTSVSTFFDRPIVVQGPKGRVLACAVFKEITSNYTDVSSEAEGSPMDDKNLSGAVSSASVAVWLSVAASIFVIAALF